MGDEENVAKPRPVAAEIEGSDAYVLANDGWQDEHVIDAETNGEPRRLSWFQSVSGRIVNNPHFDKIIIILVAINSVTMGIATSDAVVDNPNARRAFEIVDVSFLVLFTIELILDLCHKGLHLFKSGWLTFDFLVITLSWAFPVMQIMRAFRCLRLLVRIQSVKKMLLALQTVLPMLGSIVVLLSAIFYVFAVIFTGLFKSMYSEGLTSIDYFSRLDKTLFTLFQVMTGAGWPDIAREVMAVYPWAWFPFVSFIFITMFVVIELTVAALCKSVLTMEEMGIMGGSEPTQEDRIASLERTIGILNKKTGNVSAKGKKTPECVSAPPVMNRTTSTSLWYDGLALSFDGFQESQSLNSGAEESGQCYNCFPQQFQSLSAAVVQNKLFQVLIVVLIVINSATMGIATFDFVTEDARMVKIFDGIDLAFLLIFTAELLFQFGYRGLGLFKRGWLSFDFLVITLSWVFPSIQVVRAFRCFRLFSRIHFMRHIIVALFSVMPKIGIIAALLLLMFYIFGVLFTDMFKHMYEDGLTSEDYFSNLGTSLFTLFQCMTIAGWPDIAREVMQTYDWAWLPFVTWIILSKFTMIQLIIAVLCQSLAHVSTGSDTKDDNSDEISSLERKVELLTNNINTLMAYQKHA